MSTPTVQIFHESIPPMSDDIVSRFNLPLYYLSQAYDYLTSMDEDADTIRYIEDNSYIKEATNDDPNPKRIIDE